MTSPQSRREREEAQQREALANLERLRRQEDGLLDSALATAARRATETGATDADPIELWGRRIGRALSVVAFIGLCVYLYVTYLR